MLPPAEKLPRRSASNNFRVEEGRIIAPDGSVFTAAGINVYNDSFSGMSGSAATNQILKLFPKINIIRYACQPDNFGKSWKNAPEDLLLAQFVEAATARKIVVILEDHTTIGSFNWRREDIEAFAKLAARYKNNPYVWFGTSNEPETSNHEKIAQQIRATYDAIRNAGSDAIVMMELHGGWGGEHLLEYPSYYAGGPVPRYPNSGPGAGGSTVSPMNNVIIDMHFYAWWNARADVATLSDALLNGCNTKYGRMVGLNQLAAVRSGDGQIPVVIGEWGIDWDGDNVMRTVLATRPSPLYPIGNIAWNWWAGAPDQLQRNGRRTEYGDAVNDFINSVVS